MDTELAAAGSALAGVGLGWLTQELSTYFASRRQRRAAIGRALSVLLEVRFHLLLRKHMWQSLAAGLGEHATEEQLAEAVEEIEFLKVLVGGTPDELAEDYGDAVASIAATDPLLAYRLRNKNHAYETLVEWSEWMDENDGLDEAPGMRRQLERRFVERILPGLEDAIEEVARLHGVWTAHRTARTLRRPLDEDGQTDAWIGDVKEIALASVRQHRHQQDGAETDEG